MTAYPPPPDNQQPQGPPPPPQGPPPPPPVPGQVPVHAAPPVAWLIPLAAVLAVIGAFAPWFRPHADKGSQSVDFDNLYSFKDGKIGLIAPIVLVVVGIGAISVLRGKVRGRLAAAPDPVRTSARYAVIAGAVSAVCLVIAWFLVTSQYKFENGSRTDSWSDYEKQLSSIGATLSRGPQLGYWLTVAAAALAIIGGVLTYVMAQPAATASPPPGAYPPPASGPSPSLEKSPPPPPV